MKTLLLSVLASLLLAQNASAEPAPQLLCSLTRYDREFPSGRELTAGVLDVGLLKSFSETSLGLEARMGESGSAIAHAYTNFAGAVLVLRIRYSGEVYDTKVATVADLPAEGVSVRIWEIEGRPGVSFSAQCSRR